MPKLAQLPHMARGYARGPGESEYPELWRGLVAEWPFGMQGSGNKIYELARGLPPGTFNSAPFWTSGKFGRVLDFDGVDDYIDLGVVPGIGGITNLSVGCWIQNDDIELPNVFSYFGRRNPNSSWSLRKDTSERFSFLVYNEAVSSAQALSPVNSNEDLDWHFIVGTYDGSTIRIYVDGNKEGENSFSGNVRTVSDSVTVGHITQGTGGHVDGRIDDPFIYNKVLTPSEIKLRYNTPYAPFVKRRRIYFVPAAPASSFPPNSLALSGVGR